MEKIHLGYYSYSLSTCCCAPSAEAHSKVNEKAGSQLELDLHQATEVQWLQKHPCLQPL